MAKKVSTVYVTRVPELPELSELPSGGGDVPLYDGITNKLYRIKAALLGGGTSTKVNWSSAITYDIGDIVEYGLKLWKSLINDNTGNAPIEGANWTEVSKSSSDGFGYWAPGVYTIDPTLVLNGGYIYYLDSNVTTLPFESVNFATEVENGQWKKAGNLTAAEIVTLLQSLGGDDRLDASAIKNLPVEPAAGGYANNLYLSNIDSDVMGYKTTSYSPDMVEVLVSTSVSAADGEKVVQNYLYPQPVGIDTYPSGLWAFNFFMYLSRAYGVTQIGVTYFKRSAAGVETDLFTAWSDEVNDTAQAYRQIQITNPVYTVDPTDRMGARVKIKTTNVSAITVNYVVGDGYGAWLTTPNRIRHSQLRDFDGDPNYQHITATERAQIQLDPSGFDGNLTPSDDTLQKVAQKFDDYGALVNQTFSGVFNLTNINGVSYTQYTLNTSLTPTVTGNTVLAWTRLVINAGVSALLNTTNIGSPRPYSDIFTAGKLNEIVLIQEEEGVWYNITVLN